MNILWLVHKPLAVAAPLFGEKVSPYGGWIDGLFGGVIKAESIQLSVMFPADATQITQKECDGIRFWGYPRKWIQKVECDIAMIEGFKTVIDQLNPDIVHIFGSEFPSTVAMTKAFDKPWATIIGIQGLVSVYADHYYAGLPDCVVRSLTVRDVIRGGIRKDRERYERRGKLEIDAISAVNHVLGRTDWDCACTHMINPNAFYHFCGETLRDVFYCDDTWNHEACEKHAIFISQAGYPIKGLHHVLKALHWVLLDYPDAVLYMAGGNMLKMDSGIKGKLKLSAYAKYCRKLINDYKLQDHVKYLGILNAEKMKEMYLRTNVFVSASAIENSPNSIGESMILGVPTVSSYVGGLCNLLEHGKEGYLYQADAPYMLAYYIRKVFDDEIRATRLGKNARCRALSTYNRDKNLADVLSVYQDIYSDAVNGRYMRG